MSLKSLLFGTKPEPGISSIDKDMYFFPNDVSFKKFEMIFSKGYGIFYDKQKYPSYFSYVSSLFLADMLESSFIKLDLNLPDDLSVLDFGAGNWSYVHTLYNFFQDYRGKRNVHMVGIDALGKKYTSGVEERISTIHASYIPKDIRKILPREKFDIVFMSHMLSSKNQFFGFGVKPMSNSEIFSEALKLLRDEGLFIGISYQWAGESSLLSAFSGATMLDDYYNKYISPSVDEFIYGYHTFNENVILIGKKN